MSYHIEAVDLNGSQIKVGDSVVFNQSGDLVKGTVTDFVHAIRGYTAHPDDGKPSVIIIIRDGRKSSSRVKSPHSVFVL